MAYTSFLEPLGAIIRSTGELLEGNCVYKNQTLEADPLLDSKRRNLERAASFASRICEIGFNAGHSALAFLLAADPKTTFVFFDLGEHAYTRPCFQHLQQTFPGVAMQAVYGDSRTTLPRWIQANPAAVGSFDVVHVDGGHSLECATSDLFAAYLLAKPGGIIILDDINNSDIISAVNVWMREGLLNIDASYEVTALYPHAVLRKMG
jgi:hypothetical protein